MKGADEMSSSKVDTLVPSWVQLLSQLLFGDITCATTLQTQTGLAVIVSISSQQSKNVLETLETLN